MSKQHKLFWGSSYDRGLDVLLYLWSDVKTKLPDAELHVCYGWDLFDKATANNEERKQWKIGVQRLMQQDGVIHHGRLGKKALREVRKKCGIWAYPTYFTEINCITALECQRDGCVPVTMTLAALDETVQSGVKVDGDIKDEKVIEKYKQALLDMMSDKKKWSKEVSKGKNFAKKHYWENISTKWLEVFVEKPRRPLVSIITPTIREGFWDVMYSNIKDQTYKNIEWIIVDDHKNNRKNIAERYGARYFRGKKKNSRKYGLSSANNIGWENSKGELCIWLQDFMFMPVDGVEQLVDLYLHNPNSLIAPVDVYHNPAISGIVGNDLSDSIHWNDFVGDFLWRNSRNKRLGIRKTENPADFEMNYGAIPRSVLERIGGFWEFFDEALGYDNTEIAHRALESGSDIIIDDMNIAIGIDHWGELKNKQSQLGEGRTHALNDPRFEWMLKQMKSGKLPLRREKEIDDSIELKYEIPKELDQDGAVEWMRKNMKNILNKWGDL